MDDRLVGMFGISPFFTATVGVLLLGYGDKSPPVSHMGLEHAKPYSRRCFAVAHPAPEIDLPTKIVHPDSW